MDLCIVDQLTGFNMSATLVWYRLIICPKLGQLHMNQYIDQTRFYVIPYLHNGIFELDVEEKEFIISYFYWQHFYIFEFCFHDFAPLQKRIRDPMKHLRLSFDESCWQLSGINYFRKKLSILDVWQGSANNYFLCSPKLYALTAFTNNETNFFY